MHDLLWTDECCACKLGVGHDASVTVGYSSVGDKKPNSLLCIADSDQASFAQDEGSCDLSMYGL